jgi:hypothetical protein
MEKIYENIDSIFNVLKRYTKKCFVLFVVNTNIKLENCKLINSLLKLDEFEVLLSFGEKETNDLNNTLHVVPSKLVLNKTPKDNKSIIRKVTNSFKTTFINKTPIIKNLKSRNSLKFHDRDECSMNSIEKEIKVPESKFKKQGNVSNYHNYIKNVNIILKYRPRT